MHPTRKGNAFACICGASVKRCEKRIRQHLETLRSRVLPIATILSKPIASLSTNLEFTFDPSMRSRIIYIAVAEHSGIKHRRNHFHARFVPQCRSSPGSSAARHHRHSPRSESSRRRVTHPACDRRGMSQMSKHPLGLQRKGKVLYWLLACPA